MRYIGPNITRRSLLSATVAALAFSAPLAAQTAASGRVLHDDPVRVNPVTPDGRCTSSSAWTS